MIMMMERIKKVKKYCSKNDHEANVKRQMKNYLGSVWEQMTVKLIKLIFFWGDSDNVAKSGAKCNFERWKIDLKIILFN